METIEVVMAGIQLKKLIERMAEPIMQEYGLRLVELDLLVFLSNEKNVDTAKDIIHERHLSKAHISKAIDNLHTRGFIRLTEDSEDHRVLHISLNEISGEVVRKVMSMYGKCKEIMQKGLSGEEAVVVKEAVRKINRNINGELEKLEAGIEND